MTELPEEVLAGNAQMFAARVVRSFWERLGIVEHERAATDESGQRPAAGRSTSANRRVVEVDELIEAADELTKQLQQALETRTAIEQAKGLLVGRHGVTPDAALDAIRQYAGRSRLPLQTVARDLMSGRTRIEM